MARDSPDIYLESTAMDTVVKSNGGMEHLAHPGVLAQVLHSTDRVTSEIHLSGVGFAKDQNCCMLHCGRFTISGTFTDGCATFSPAECAIEHPGVGLTFN